MIITEAFIPLALARRRTLGVHELPLAVIPHPLGGLPPERVQERADAAVEQIIHALTAPVGQLVAEEQQRGPRAPGNAHGR